MRPVREITAEEENFRMEPMGSGCPGCPQCMITRRDPVEPEATGTIIITAFRIVGYDPDCDGSLMARLEHIDSSGEPTGWCPRSVGLYPTTDLVVTLDEWAKMFCPDAETEAK